VQGWAKKSTLDDSHYVPITFTGKTATIEGASVGDIYCVKYFYNNFSARQFVVNTAYIPSIVMGVGTLTCVFGAHVLNKQRQASLIGAYTLLDSSYKEYKQKVLDLYGENANNEVTEAIAKDKYDKDDHKVEPGKQLFYEAYSGRYFESTMEDVLRAEYTLNRELSLVGGVAVNDYYELLGLDRVDEAKDFGWAYDTNMDMYWQAWVDFNHTTSVMDDGLECTIITMWQEPVIDYEYY
jgi:hypothetical protein